MKRKDFLLLLFLAIALPFLFSCTYSKNYQNIDADIFFLCGKAWVNGMAPYQDFSDSKGPLLWVIYGFGYIFTPTSLVGMYLMECLFDFVTLFYFYKILMLTNMTYRWRALAAFVSGIMLYYYGYHQGTVSETFCMPFLMCAWYWTYYIIYSEKEKHKHNLYVGAFSCGIASMASLLIKYNMTAIIGIMLLCVFSNLLISQIKLNWGKLIGCYAIGLLVVALPFVAYFQYLGVMNIFFYDYFEEVSETIKNLHRDSLFGGAIQFLRNYITLLLFLFVLMGSSLYLLVRASTVMKKVTMLVCVVISLLIIMPNGIFSHYYEPLFPYASVPIVLVFGKLSRSKSLFVPSFVFSILFLIGNYWLYYDRGRTPLKSNINLEEHDSTYNGIETILCRKHKPGIMYVGGFGGGYGMKSEALPGCKFFFPQAGMTGRMVRLRLLAIEAKKSDFIIVLNNGDRKELLAMNRAGYKKLFEGPDGEGKLVSVYGVK